MSVLTGTHVSKSFGAFDLFADLNFSVAHGNKIALVGANGCGKTTLLTIIAGLQEPNIGGGVSFARGITRGYLSQTAEEGNEHTIWQEMQTAFVVLNVMAAKLQQLEQALAEPSADHDVLLARYGTLQHEFEIKGGYEVDSKIKRILGGLGFKPGEELKPLSQLSGGQRVRAALAKLLLQSPDVLLLDEPTNHLDRQGIEWLEGYLQEWNGTLLVVSHDRYFLDEVCDYVWEMGKRSDGMSYMEVYRGGYTDYVAQRTDRRERQLKEFEAQQEAIAKEQEYIRRNIAGQNTSIAKGRQTRLNRMARLEKPLETRAMALRLSSGPRSGNIVLETSALMIGYRSSIDDGMRSGGDEENGLTPSPHHPIASSPHPKSRPLFTVPNLQLLRTERAALIGANGTGKTTFLKTVLGSLPPLGGEARLGASLRMGYFAQAHEGLNLANTVLEELMSAREDMKMSEARNILGRFLFSGDDAFKKLEMLSGGERGRVALAKLTLQGANFLLLDEPTNHLDIPSQEILTDALNNFDGTLLVVSHDRYLVAALATQIWSLDRTDDGQTQMMIFRGTYDAWVEDRLAREAKAVERETSNVKQPALSRTKGQTSNAQSPKPITSSPHHPITSSQTLVKPAATPPPNTSPAFSKNQEQQRLKKLAAVEARITQLEKQQTEVSWQMELAGGDYEKLKALGEDYAKIEADLADAWAELEKIG